MKYFILLLTDRILCISDNYYLRDEYKEYMGSDSVYVFDFLDDAHWFISENLTYNDLWMFGLRSVQEIQLGRLYVKEMAETP